MEPPGASRRIVFTGGWAPHRHVGDDVILRVHLDSLAAAGLDADPIVLGSDPVALRERFGVETAPDLSSFLNDELEGWRLPQRLAVLLAAASGTGPAPDDPGARAVLETVSTAAALICLGAGSLASEYGQVLQAQAAIVEMAHVAGVPIAICGVTLGPVTSPVQAIQLRRMLAAADLVEVRDRGASVAEATALGRPNVACGWDPAVWLRPAPISDGTPTGAALLGADAHTADLFGEAVDALAELGTSTLGVPMDFYPPASDAGALRRLTGERPHFRVLDPVPDDDLLLALADRAPVVFGSRYHAAVFAAARGTPSVLVHRDAYTRRKAEGLADLSGPIVRLVDAGDGPTAIRAAVIEQSRRPRGRPWLPPHPLPAISWLSRRLGPAQTDGRAAVGAPPRNAGAVR